MTERESGDNMAGVRCDSHLDVESDSILAVAGEAKDALNHVDYEGGMSTC